MNNEKRPRGFFGCLADFLRLLEEMEKKGEGMRAGSGVVTGPGYSGIEYEYSVRFLGKKDPPAGRKPLRRPWKVRFSKERYDLMEAPIEVFDQTDHIIVMAQLPDVKGEDITLKVVGDTLKIGAKMPRGKIERNIKLPRGGGARKIHNVSFKNGVLEVKIRKGGEFGG